VRDEAVGGEKVTAAAEEKEGRRGERSGKGASGAEVRASVASSPLFPLFVSSSRYRFSFGSQSMVNVALSGAPGSRGKTVVVRSVLSPPEKCDLLNPHSRSQSSTLLPAFVSGETAALLSRFSRHPLVVERFFRPAHAQASSPSVPFVPFLSHPRPLLVSSRSAGRFLTTLRPPSLTATALLVSVRLFVPCSSTAPLHD
jgi:hypothetical protein